MIKERLNYLLARKPNLYERLISIQGRANFEKIAFLNLVRNGDFILDIGANRGYYTLLFSHIAGRNGQVHAFEPVPTTFAMLYKNIHAAKRFDNIYLNEVAAGDKNGEVNLYLPDEDDGQASMAIHDSGSWESVKSIKTSLCKIIRLDDYVASNNIKRLDFIKCDVEGAELSVLRGLTDTVGECLPILYLEVCNYWTRDFEYTPGEIIELLSSFGYSKYYLIENGLRTLTRPETDLSPENHPGSANLLCTIPELHSPRLNQFLKNYS